MAGYPGRQGRKPKPTALKVIHETARPDRTNASEPKPRAALPTCPAWLPPDARTVWRRVLREMGATGVITAANGDMLAMYCYQYTVCQGYAARGEVIPPQQLAQLRALASAFGLDPSSRSRLHVALVTEDDDPLAALLAGTGR